MNMKMLLKKMYVCVAVLGVSACEVLAQGTFENLSFESPILPLNPDSNGFVAISNALPHWIGYLGGLEQTQVLYNDLSLGSSTLALLGPGQVAGVVISGQFTVALQPGLGFTGRESATIGQSGQIANDVKSLQFFALFLGVGPDVSFAQQPLLLVPLGPGPNGSTRYGADVSTYAGMSGELRFTAPDVTGFPNDVFLDDIFFSPEAIPEPGVISLLALGALLFVWRQRRKTRST